MPTRLLAAALGLLLAPLCRADAVAEATLKKAIEAHGGAEALKKALTCQRRSAGKLVGPTETIAFEAETTRDLPDRLRLEVKGEKGLEVITVMVGDKGWIKTIGPAMPMVAERLGELKEESYAAWVSLLVPLLDKSFTLTSVKGTKVNKEETVAVKASRKGTRDTTLYFSAKTGLLVKVARRAPDAGRVVFKEYLYHDHKLFDGVRLPAREVHLVNERVNTELEIKGYRFARGPLDKKLFDRP